MVTHEIDHCIVYISFNLTLCWKKKLAKIRKMCQPVSFGENIFQDHFFLNDAKSWTNIFLLILFNLSLIASILIKCWAFFSIFIHFYAPIVAAVYFFKTDWLTFKVIFYSDLKKHRKNCECCPLSPYHYHQMSERS